MWEEARKENRGPVNRAGWKKEGSKTYITTSHKPSVYFKPPPPLVIAATHIIILCV